jgi:hypothetical protein
MMDTKPKSNFLQVDEIEKYLRTKRRKLGDGRYFAMHDGNIGKVTAEVGEHFVVTSIRTWEEVQAANYFIGKLARGNRTERKDMLLLVAGTWIAVVVMAATLGPFRWWTLLVAFLAVALTFQIKETWAETQTFSKPEIIPDRPPSKRQPIDPTPQAPVTLATDTDSPL